MPISILKKIRRNIKKLIPANGGDTALCGRPVAECEECPVRDKLRCGSGVINSVHLAAPVALIFFPAVAGMLRF